MLGQQFVGQLVKAEFPKAGPGDSQEPFGVVQVAGNRQDGEPYWFKAVFRQKDRGVVTEIATALEAVSPGVWVALGFEQSQTKYNKPYNVATAVEVITDPSPPNGKAPVAAAATAKS